MKPYSYLLAAAMSAGLALTSVFGGPGNGGSGGNSGGSNTGSGGTNTVNPPLPATLTASITGQTGNVVEITLCSKGNDNTPLAGAEIHATIDGIQLTSGTGSPPVFSVAGADGCVKVYVTLTSLSGCANLNANSRQCTVQGRTYEETQLASNIQLCPPTPPPAPAAPTPITVTKPVITANNLTVSAGADCSGIAYFNATASDENGAVTVSYSFNGNPISTGASWGVGSYTITASATNAAGTSTKTFTLTVVDDTPPTISVPANITKNTDAGVCNAVVTFAATATDNCGVASVIASPASGTVFAKGTTTVTITATDLAGNVSTGSFTVTVQDKEAPLVACIQTTNPSAKNIPAAGSTAGNSGQNPDGFYQLLGSDNCDTATLSLYVKDSASGFIAGPFKSLDKIKLIQAPGATPNQKLMPQGYTQIQLKGDGILTATDSSGNVGTCNCLVPQKAK